jgi:hypothetical protein
MMIVMRSRSHGCVLLVLALLALGCVDRRGRPSVVDGGVVRMDGGPGGMDGGPGGVDGGPGGVDGGPGGVDGGPGGVDGGPGGVDGGPLGMDGGPPRVDGGPSIPDGGPGGITISMIQRGMVPEDTIVTVRNVVVTALYSTGVWVQDPAGGSTYSGIRVYEGVAPTVALHDRVDVTGTYIEYFDDSEIEFATITRRGTATPIAPASLTAASAAAEQYEGVLVRVSGTVTSLAYSCAIDDPGCFDSELWEIGGPSGVLAYDYVYQSTDWSSRVGTVPVTGVMMWRYGRRRVMPRTSADF